MNPKILILIISSIFISCSTEQYSKKTDNEKYAQIAPSMYYYGTYNFVLNDTRIFIHRKSRYYVCGENTDFSKPQKIDLVPNDLVEIQKKDINEFLMKTFNTDFKGSIYISSINDSDNNLKNIILKFFKENTINGYVVSRKSTEEEMYVTNSIVQNTLYDPNKVKWKIGFFSY